MADFDTDDWLDQLRAHFGAAPSSPYEPAERDSTPFIPELSLKLTRGAVLRVTILNFSEYWAKNYPLIGDDEDCFQIVYGFLFDADDADNIRRRAFEAGMQKSIKIETYRVNKRHRDNPELLHIKMPQFLYSYDFKLSMSAYNPRVETWMKLSKTHIIKIPPIWTPIKPEYQIKDVVKVKLESRNILYSAEIIGGCNNGKYELYRCPDQKIECDKSSIYANIEIGSSIRMFPHVDVMIKMDLFSRKRCEATHAVYMAIADGISELDEVMEDCYIYYCESTRPEWTVQGSILDCFAYHIIQFLIEPDFHHTVYSPLVNGQKPLKMVQGMYYTELVNRFLAWEWCNLDPDILLCALCRIPFTQWDFFYVDQDVKLMDAHQYCCSCVMDMINVYDEVVEAVYPVLKYQLDKDCIREIFQFLVGKVFYTEYVDEKTNESEQDAKKRALEGANDSAPNTKRRKLNEFEY